MLIHLLDDNSKTDKNFERNCKTQGFEGMEAEGLKHRLNIRIIPKSSHIFKASMLGAAAVGFFLTGCPS